MNRTRAKGQILGLMLLGLVLLAGAGCGLQSTKPANPTEPTVTFKPQEMADVLHAVIAADQKVYAFQGDEKWMALHAQRLGEAAAAIQQQGAEFHYVLRSLEPINPKNVPQTDMEKSGLQYVRDHPGINFYGPESLGGRRYFTAVYPEMASDNICTDCHNQNPAGVRKDFKVGDIMGGLVIRVPVEFRFEPVNALPNEEMKFSSNT